ncbi:hypothetical protein AAGW05_01080 [Arthrobacter sp. LAPM80]|uniref:hypothetical protein n=1 Tax=Arthrobacter sp. LAPM80 TaxID=3141788 RepID=UPI00398A8A37
MNHPSTHGWRTRPGGPVLRALRARRGQGDDSLQPIGKLALNRLLQMSQGTFTQEMIDGLMQQV